jgi:hypothetical protein
MIERPSQFLARLHPTIPFSWPSGPSSTACGPCDSTWSSRARPHRLASLSRPIESHPTVPDLALDIADAAKLFPALGLDLGGAAIRRRAGIQQVQLRLGHAGMQLAAQGVDLVDECVGNGLG